MPPLPDPDPQILSPSRQPRPRPQHPSPLIDGLALEIESGIELGYHGAIFGIDTPYYAAPLGWGEWAPLVDT